MSLLINTLAQRLEIALGLVALVEPPGGAAVFQLDAGVVMIRR